MRRFIINERSKKIHDRENLVENCNTDQIQGIWRSDADEERKQKLMQIGYKICGWCGRFYEVRD